MSSCRAFMPSSHLKVSIIGLAFEPACHHKTLWDFHHTRAKTLKNIACHEPTILPPSGLLA